MPSTDQILSAALVYAENGLSVIPVSRDKKPLLKSWKEYQDRYATEEEILSWWEQWPDANVAIITGKISDLVGVDADGSEGIDWI